MYSVERFATISWSPIAQGRGCFGPAQRTHGTPTSWTSKCWRPELETGMGRKIVVDIGLATQVLHAVLGGLKSFATSTSIPISPARSRRPRLSLG